MNGITEHDLYILYKIGNYDKRGRKPGNNGSNSMEGRKEGECTRTRKQQPFTSLFTFKLFI